MLDELGRSHRIATARYVGDAPDDMRMARAAGSIGVGIESSIGTRDDLFAAGANAVYPGVAEFVDELLGPRVTNAALILADGAAPTRSALDSAWPGWDAGIALVVAADGGARHAAALGLRVDRWVGDGDSIEPGDLAALAAAGVEIQLAAADKDESDAELAILAAVQAGVGAVTILGALGGLRIDHALANVGLLGHPALIGLAARLYDEGAARISLLTAPDALRSRGHARAGGTPRRSRLARAGRHLRRGRDHERPAVSAGGRAAGPRPDARRVQCANRTGGANHARIGPASRDRNPC